ncbi:hypothetical protein [Aquitalea denitrificans]|uniref:hypothetical protein n=1 Tax=Aquitalea denitrificans TaxID=519081 RepID=UPI00135B8BAD|nr:hypothetical protein [Aquitalea denitrificans]
MTGIGQQRPFNADNLSADFYIAELNMKRVFLAIFFMSLTSFAHADVGLPMIVVFFPISILAFIPIVLIESLVICKILNVRWKLSVKVAFLANLVSSVAGIPLAWFILLLFEFTASDVFLKWGLSNSYPPSGVRGFEAIILTAPWLGQTNDNWSVPFAVIVLLIPFFLVSCWIESWYAAKWLSPSNVKNGVKAMWWANAASYLFLLAMCSIWLIWAISKN